MARLYESAYIDYKSINGKTVPSAIVKLHKPIQLPGDPAYQEYTQCRTGRYIPERIAIAYER